MVIAERSQEKSQILGGSRTPEGPA
jgi:hypothetical protein